MTNKAINTQTQNRTNSSKEFAAEIEQLLISINRVKDNRLKLILHVGTPKTGTTSVQAYLDKKQRKLRSKGILYPNRFHNPHAPKHQWFERNLLGGDIEKLVENMRDVINHIEEHTHTILLSSEGIYNHWWDFSVESKAILFELSKLFDVEIWVWFRNPLGFAESFYKQCMRNPQVEHISCYGKDLSFGEVLEDSWFFQHLDYIGFVEECDNLFAEDAVKVFNCDKDTVETFKSKLGLKTQHDNPVPHKNNCMKATTVELYRVINRLQISAKERERLVPLLNELDAVLTPMLEKESNSLIDDELRLKLSEMTAEGMSKIQKRFAKEL